MSSIINFYKDYLDFHYINKIIPTPLSHSLKEKLHNTMERSWNKVPIIVDSNLASNYHFFH